MSNEVKHENKGSVMSAMLKSTVGKLAILAGAAISMSSCTRTLYVDSSGRVVSMQSSGVSAGQVVTALGMAADTAVSLKAINKGGHVYHGMGGHHGIGGHHGSTGQTFHCHGQTYFNMGCRH
jgi:hypothetical protein